MSWAIQIKLLGTGPQAPLVLQDSRLLSSLSLLSGPFVRPFGLPRNVSHCQDFLSAWWARSPAEVLEGSSVSLPGGKVEVA